MDVDWWARGIGVAALVIAIGGFAWRVFEWWLTNRPRIRVKGSACTAVSGNRFYYGDSFSPTHFSVAVVNIGKRPITVTSVGFEEIRLPLTRRRTRYYLFTGIPGQLPTRLDQAQDVTVYAGIGGELGEEVKSGLKVVPFCKDAEDHVHKGKTDEHFKRFVAARRSNVK